MRLTNYLVVIQRIKIGDEPVDERASPLVALRLIVLNYFFQA